MSAVRMDGKMVSAKVRGSILEEVNGLKDKGVRPGLAVIIVGEDPASKVYVRNKERACEECGFYSEKYALPEETTQEELLGLIDELNHNPRIDGILCQLPVPKHINEQAIIDAISPEKDVDAFHPINVGKIMVGNFDFLPCTPAGVMQLLEEYDIDPNGKNCVVIGRSNIVGKPAALMNKEDKMRAIGFLSQSGAFLVTKSGDKVAKYFGISKYTLYSYIDKQQEDKQNG